MLAKVCKDERDNGVDCRQEPGEEAGLEDAVWKEREILIWPKRSNRLLPK